MKKTTQEILSSYNIDIKSTTAKDFITLCPFHNDTNPSFSIDKYSGVYHCWSCNAKGNLITLVQHIENVSYNDAKDKVYGDEKLSTMLYFTSINVFKKEIKPSNYFDLRYYKFKYLLLSKVKNNIDKLISMFIRLEYIDNINKYCDGYEDLKYANMLNEISNSEFKEVLDEILELVYTDEYKEKENIHMRKVKKLYDLYNKNIKHV